MSLTSQLHDPRSGPSRFMRENFPNVQSLRPGWKEALEGSETIRPEQGLGGHWGTLGTAIDYRLRFYFPQEEARPPVAARGIAAIARAGGEGARWARLFGQLLGGLPSALTQSTSDSRLPASLEDDVNRHCVALALFEQIYRRAGALPGSPLLRLAKKATLEDLLSLADPVWLEDMRALSWAFCDKFAAELCSLPAVLNPVFDGSREIGGADADLILDRCLLDIKTVTKPSLGSDIVYEVLGYVLLDYTDAYALTGIGFYLSRQATLVRWPLDEALHALAGGSVDLAQMRSAFEEVVAAS